jgi:hypothetical protein
MGEGREAMVSWRTRFRGAEVDALETTVQVPATIEEPLKNVGFGAPYRLSLGCRRPVFASKMA